MVACQWIIQNDTKLHQCRSRSYLLFFSVQYKMLKPYRLNENIACVCLRGPLSVNSILWQRTGSLDEQCACADVLCYNQQGQAALRPHTHAHTHTSTVLWPWVAQALVDPSELCQFKHCDSPDLGKALARRNLSMQIHPISSDKTPPHVQASRTHILQGSSALAIHRLGTFYFLRPSHFPATLQSWTVGISHSQIAVACFTVDRNQKAKLSDL